MDVELQKLVESGKLTSKAAEQVEKLRPGTFCLHKSWGFGRVAEWNLLLNQIVIDFTGKKCHAMQVQYAAENLTALSPEHFLARKARDLPSINNFQQQFMQSGKLETVVANIENVPARNQRVHQELAYEVIFARDDLVRRLPQLRATHIGRSLSDLLRDEGSR